MFSRLSFFDSSCWTHFKHWIWRDKKGRFPGARNKERNWIRAKRMSWYEKPMGIWDLETGPRSWGSKFTLKNRRWCLSCVSLRHWNEPPPQSPEPMKNNSEKLVKRGLEKLYPLASWSSKKCAVCPGPCVVQYVEHMKGKEKP